jgi:hypothetical protein
VPSMFYINAATGGTGYSTGEDPENLANYGLAQE